MDGTALAPAHSSGFISGHGLFRARLASVLPRSGFPARIAVAGSGAGGFRWEIGMELLRTHHVAIICSDYARSRRFYTEVLGLEVIAEVFRQERNSYKLDLRIPDGTQIELSSFPDPPRRPSYPEACGLEAPRLRGPRYRRGHRGPARARGRRRGRPGR